MQTGGLPGAGEGASDPLLGRNIAGKFVLEKLLGAGAMGAVYRARQTALEKVVAIKVMHGELARDAMFAARFHREAKAASRLDHDNSIRILDYGQDPDGLLYIAMEYLDGRDLAHLLVQDFPLAPPRIIDLRSQALGAIAVAHDLGITHRDLKPENIMVLKRRTDDGVDIDVVKVCDFGIAKLADAADAGSPASVNADDPTAAAAVQAKGKLTTAGLVIGTPAYMSPEQGRGEAIDGRSDLYSMGVILYQLLTGQLPFDAPSAIGIVIKHQTEAPAPPSSLRGGVDPQLEAVCLRALQKSPADRYQTARDFRAALRAGNDAAHGPYSGARAGDSFPSVPGLTAAPIIPTAALSGPEVGVARTELQLAAVPTAPAAVLPSRAVVSGVEPVAPARRVWPALVAAAAVLLGGGGAAAWRLRPHTEAFVRPGQVLSVQAGGTDLQGHPTSTAATVPGPAGGANGGTTSPSDLPIGTASTTLRGPETDVSRRGLGPASTVVVPRHAVGGGAHPAPGSLSPAPEPPKVVEPVRAPDPPAPVVLAPTPAPPPAPDPVAPQAPAAPSFSLDTATVDLGAPFNLAQTGGTSITEAMGHVKGAIVKCYKDALPRMQGPLEGKGTLHIEADDDGTIQKAQLSGGVRGGGVLGCIQGAVVGAKLRQHDTGPPSADVPLEFRAK